MAETQSRFGGTPVQSRFGGKPLSPTQSMASSDAIEYRMGADKPQGGSILNPLAQGATLGFGDEIAAGGATLIGQMLPESMGGLPAGTGWGDAYSGIREGINQNTAEFAERNPKTALAAEVAGGLTTGGMGLAKALPALAPKGAGLLRNTLATSAVGGAEGAIAGAGYSDEGNRLQGAVTGGGLGLATGALLGAPAHVIGGRINKNRDLDKLITESPDARTAAFQLTSKGKRVKDKAAIEAMNQGIDDTVVSTIKSASPQDRQNMNKMLEVLTKGRTDAKFAATNRPSDIIGDSVLKRFKVVNAANKKAGSELGAVANGLKGQKVDTMDALSSFANNLDDMGIQYNDAGKLDFTGSDIEGLPVRSVVNKIVKRLESVTDDANDVHKFKQWVDELVSYGKQPGGALTGKTERLIKGLRHDMDAALDGSFPEYKKVNDVYGSTKGAINDFMTAAGTRFDPNASNANARVGTLSRRILSNAQSRTEVLNTIQNLQSVAEQNGAKFSDDIVSQTVFADQLEKLFGNFGTTSLGGEVGKVSARDTVNLANTLRSKGVVGAATDMAASGIDKARGRSDEGLIESIGVLLAR